MKSLAAEERWTWLLEQLKESKAISLTDAAEALGVSEMTVRRDLSGMEERGIARRVRGGAVYSGPVSFQGRERSHAEEKAAIAQKLLPFVPTSGVIAMDSSTTINRLALALPPVSDLTVVTNGLSTFQTLQDRPGVTAILTGGAGDKRSDSLIGPVATAFLDSIRFSAFFASAAALDERMLYEDTLEEAEVKRAFARSSVRILIGAHAEKLDDVATATAIPLDRVSVLATELAPDQPELAPYARVVGTIL
ncbi:DeoR/GlpR family DNA-binding transcription regulator [Microbacterium capsulatum]|uniref:DeoR/GlpR family DNA-binding transcription regulator n=1 Tax=Microbacterium capsulatum TaxID=3041921 RepID=A0ABU0XKZ6_9MICO|nr:DeoR/GlpR family DNA-binding transcription regulator [Microbacterium sp. ASV81]MDQ4215822.1 DeoR/GlpR family DNA-binding transcription regulator [Microbacterium sp. ASV81]